jgi:outer membrane protein assembly factor BamB
VVERKLPVPGGGGIEEKDDLFSRRSRRVAATIGGVVLAAAVVLGIVFSARLVPATAVPEGVPPAPGPPGGQPVSVPGTTAATSGTPEAVPAFPSREEILRNWPCFRGPDGIGVAYCTRAPVEWDGLSGKGILWKTEVPRAGMSSPVVWGDRVFLTGGDEEAREVFCFDANEGTLLWRAEMKDIPDPPEKLPEPSEDTGFAAPSAATDGRRVYAIFATGELAAFDFEGKMVWGKNLGVPENDYGHASSLMMFYDVLLVQIDQAGDSRLLGIDAPTGDVVWETDRETEPSWASPIVVETDEGYVAILCAEPRVAAYDPETGLEMWSVECIDGEIGASAAYADGIVFAGNDNTKLSAIEIETKEALWETYDDLPDAASLLATKQFVFLAMSGGVLTCRAAREDKVCWQESFDEGFYASPVLVGKNLYVMDREGLMRVIKAAGKYEPVATCPLGEKSDCTPAIVAGRIFIRGAKHLWCVGDAKVE